MSTLNPKAGAFVPSDGSSDTSEVNGREENKLVYSKECLLEIRASGVLCMKDLEQNGKLDFISKAKKKKSKKKFVNAEEEAIEAKRKTERLLNDVQDIEMVKMGFNSIPIHCSNTICIIVEFIFNHAIKDTNLCHLHAEICEHLSANLPEYKEGSRTINFRRVLLTKCYESLDSDSVLDPSMSNSTLGNVVFIGELFKRKLLTENILHVCLSMMLEKEITEQAAHTTCTLLSLIGDLLDNSCPASRQAMDEYMQVLRIIVDGDSNRANSSGLSKHTKGLIVQTLDLRKNGWKQPKKRNDVVEL